MMFISPGQNRMEKSSVAGGEANKVLVILVVSDWILILIGTQGSSACWQSVTSLSGLVGWRLKEISITSWKLKSSFRIHSMLPQLLRYPSLCITRPFNPWIQLSRGSQKRSQFILWLPAGCPAHASRLQRQYMHSRHIFLSWGVTSRSHIGHHVLDSQQIWVFRLQFSMQLWLISLYLCHAFCSLYRTLWWCYAFHALHLAYVSAAKALCQVHWVSSHQKVLKLWTVHWMCNPFLETVKQSRPSAFTVKPGQHMHRLFKAWKQNSSLSLASIPICKHRRSSCDLSM